MIAFTVILILISFIIFRIYQKTRVPDGLKNVPTLSYLKFFIEAITKVSLEERWENMREVLGKEGIGKLWINGKWMIIVTNLDLVKDILFTKSDLYPKALIQETFPRSLTNEHYGTNVIFSNGDIWKRHRRVISPAFRNLPLHIFAENAVKLLELVEKIDNEPIDVKSIMHRLTLDVLGQVSFGMDFNNLKDPNSIYVTTYKEALKEINNMLYFFIPFADYLPRTEAHAKLAKLNKIYDEIIERKRKSMKVGELDEKINNQTADTLEHMIHAANDPENSTLTDEELRYNIAMFMAAGNDTTATALSTILYLLAVHKDVQNKVRDEILRVLGDDLTPSMEQQKELEYMNMVINENLRLYPPTTLLQSRSPLKDIKFRNHIIPANTLLAIHIYGVQHSSKNWENPEKFIPERFDSGKQYDPYSLLFFGAGGRTCLGNKFSFIEQRVVLCSLLRKYEVSLPADSIHKDKLRIVNSNAGMIVPHPTIILNFKRRIIN